jgi:phage head maturation protease
VHCPTCGRLLGYREEPLSTREDPDHPDLVTRSLFVRASTANDEERSIDGLISTEAPVQVYDWIRGETIDEILLTDGAQLPEQMPLLDNHDRWSTSSVLGSSRSMRRDQATDGTPGIAGRLFFVKGDQDVERVWNRVRQGHLRDLSVGYRVDESVEIQPGQSAVVAGRTYTAGKRVLRVATKWTPREVSVTPIGADQRTKTRRDPSSFPKGPTSMNPQLRAYLESIGLRKDATDAEASAFMAKLTGDQKARADALQDGQRSDPPAGQTATGQTQPAGSQRSDPPPTPPASGNGGATTADVDEAARRAVVAERDRVRQLTELAGEDVPQETLRRAINDGWDMARASNEFLTAVRSNRAPGQNAAAPYQPSAHTGPMGNASVRSLAAGMMLGYGISDPTKHTMHNGRRDPTTADRLTAQDVEAGQRFQRLSLVDMIRMSVQMDTGRLYWDPSEAFEAVRTAPSGGTLAYIFSTNVYARLIEGWATVGDTTVGWCEEEDVANFLQQEDISLAANARLQQLPRGDTAKDATISDSHETYKIARYAKKFTVDEQDVIDDRLGAIMRMPVEMGEAARQLRPDLVYSLMLENPTMSDTGEVYNSTAVTTKGGHSNLGTGALSSTALKAAISAMVKQRLNRTAKDPGRALVLRPKFLIVPADLEWTARELTSAAALAKLFADSNDPWYAALNLLAQEGLRVVPDDRIGAIGVLDPRTNAPRVGTDKNWFLTTGRGLRVAYRRGTNRQPVMRSFVLDKGQWGMGWDINLDIGVAYTEWRTWYKSTGAAA